MSSFEHDGRRVRQVIVRDITARKALEDRLSHRAGDQCWSRAAVGWS
jgi:hypothetical protein